MKRGKDRVGYVYFVEAIGLERIKIGYSANPPEAQRLDSLRTGSPAVLRLLGAIPGRCRDEKALHQAFAHLRRHGEWFDAAPELREFIAGHPNRVAPILPSSVEPPTIERPLTREQREAENAIRPQAVPDHWYDYVEPGD